MARKLFINATGRPLTVQVAVRRGDDLLQDAGEVTVKLGAGAATPEGPDNCRIVPYGNAVDIYLNAVSLAAGGDGSETRTLFRVLQRGIALDDLLNTNNTIEIRDEDGLKLVARNSLLFDDAEAVAPVGPAEKLFVNRSGRPLEVELFVRRADDLHADAAPVRFALGTGDALDAAGGPDNCRRLRYGTDIDIYLNGLSVTASGEGGASRVQFRVAARGAPLDDLLNTNNTIEIRDEGGLRLAGTNSVSLDPAAAGALRGQAGPRR